MRLRYSRRLMSPLQVPRRSVVLGAYGAIGTGIGPATSAALTAQGQEAGGEASALTNSAQDIPQRKAMLSDTEADLANAPTAPGAQNAAYWSAFANAHLGPTAKLLPGVECQDTVGRKREKHFWSDQHPFCGGRDEAEYVLARLGSQSAAHRTILTSMSYQRASRLPTLGLPEVISNSLSVIRGDSNRRERWCTMHLRAPLPHEHEPGLFEVVNEVLRRDLRHNVVGLVPALSAIVSKGERNPLFDLVASR